MYKLTETFTCDTCGRTKKVLRNNAGFNLTQQCTITENCSGTLFSVLNPEESRKAKFQPDPVLGLNDWFQQPLLYNHTQTISANIWNVVHNLISFPYVDVLVNRLDEQGNVILVEIPPSDYKVEVIDVNSLRIIFNENVSGFVQCVAQSTENTINPQRTLSVQQTKDMQITNNSTITIATTDNSPLISFNIIYRVNNNNITINYVNVDNQPSVGSPWVNSNRVFIDGKTFVVRSFNITTQPFASNYFIQKIITNGAQLYFDLPHQPKENYILLAKAPFASVDKIQNQVIDIGTISQTQPELYYNNGDIFAQPSIIKMTYPPVYIM